MLDSNDEYDLLLHWFADIGKNVEMYSEPVLDSDAVRFFKEVCDAFEQTSYVFILSLEIAEGFIHAKNAINKKIPDPLLASVTIAFISHKFVGAPETLKVKHVIDLLFYLSQRLYSASQVTAMEGDVLMTLNGKIPVKTPLDDLDIIVEKYIQESRLRANVRPLCLRLLEFLYTKRKVWFKELKKVYIQNSDCLRVFESLISSRFYVPASILIAALRLCHYRYILDLDSLLNDITKHTRIHEDHINVCVTKILELLS